MEKIMGTIKKLGPLFYENGILRVTQFTYTWHDSTPLSGEKIGTFNGPIPDYFIGGTFLCTRRRDTEYDRTIIREELTLIESNGEEPDLKGLATKLNSRTPETFVEEIFKDIEASK